MKRISSLFLTAFIVIFSSCNNPKNQYGDVPQTIIVTGKIDNYEPNRQLTLHVNRLGFSQEQILAKMDSAGNFMATFESYIPVDVWVTYNTNFLVLLHPKDSLFVHFDGKYNDRPELLESIKFGGDRAKTNQFAAKFQQMYFSNEIYTDWDKKQKAVKEYDTDQYLQYLDTIQQKSKKLYDQFVVENRPNYESRKWGLLFIENDYYYEISWYASNHWIANQMNPDWDCSWYVPKGFYDRLCNRLPIDASMFINADGLTSFHNTFFRYVHDKLRDRETDGIWSLNGEVIDAPAEIIDSIRIFGYIEIVPDPLLLQFMLTEYFDQKFDREDIDVYEKFRDVAETYIKEPFLKEPLIQKYLKTKQRIENPQIFTDAILKEAASLSVNQIMDDILQQNKGKVVYVDFWGTWCGPCLAEMPNSKIVEHEFKDEDVVFVYICLESEEKNWKATLDKFQLGGHHYHLSRQQSGEIRTLVSISGIPFYLLIPNRYHIAFNIHLNPVIDFTVSLSVKREFTV